MARKPHDDGPPPAGRERPIIYPPVSPPPRGADPSLPGDRNDGPQEGAASSFPPAARMVSAAEGDRDEDAALRPRRFDEFVGQQKIVDNLAVYVQAARRRGDALDHVLLSGPPGLGKTTLAYLLANEMGTTVRVTS